MSRDEILALVIRHVADAGEGLKAADVDPERSMHDHDLSSLDSVEVVTRSMRDLQVKIAWPQLRKARTINDLVDILHRATAARKQ